MAAEEIKAIEATRRGSAMAHLPVKGPRKFIPLDPSRFRLERKNTVEQKYEIVQELGRGTFGEVKLVIHRETQTKRALKAIPKDRCQMTKNFAEEIEILKRLVFLSDQ